MDIKKYCDKTLIKRIQTKGDSDATEEIIARHKKIVFTVINKFCYRNPHIHKDELMDDLYLIFSKSIQSYKSYKKTKFGSWLYNQTRYHCLNTCKGKDLTYAVENKTIDDINNKNNIFQLCGQSAKNDMEYIHSILNQMEDERIKKIFKLRYFEGAGNKTLDWKTIGNKIGLSITRVISLHEEGRKMLEKKIKSVDRSDII